MELLTPIELSEDLLSYTLSILKVQDEEKMSDELTQWQGKFQQILDTKAWESLLPLFEEQIAAVLATEKKETDVEGLFNIFFVLSAKMEDKEKVAPLWFRVCSQLAENASDLTQLRLRILCNAFNKADKESSFRYDVFLVILKYAKRSGNFELISGYLENVQELIDPSLAVSKLRALYLAISEVYEQDDVQCLNVLKFLEKYLFTFQNESPEELAKARDIAVKAVTFVINEPVNSLIAKFDLTGLEAVKVLKDDSKYNQLFQLLTVFTSGSLEEYLAFHKSSVNVISDYNIDHEKCISNMRLLSFCSFGSTSSEVSFDEIMLKLQVPEEEVELWVMKAITSKLMEGKTDQLRRIVTISHCISRGFGADQWKQLSEKLNLYKKNVSALLEIIANARVAHAN